MEPLKITARISTGIVIKNDSLMFDGIVGYAYFKSLTRQEQAELGDPNRQQYPKDLPLPFDKWEAEDPQIWGYKASNYQTEWAGRDTVEIRRPAPVHAMRRLSDAKSVNTSSGPFKPLDKRAEVRFPKDGLITWYAVGDKAKITELVSTIENLGHLHNHGHGKVEGWTVESCSQSDLWKLRPLPMHSGPKRIVGVRPPYWHRSRKAECGSC